MSTLPRTMAFDYEEVARRRADKQLTLKEAADRATKALKGAGHDSNISRSRWNDIESGRYADPRISTIEAVATALQCRVQDLLTGGNQKRGGK